ncbi:MAG: hypothetical protein HZB91_13050 [Elusimicrobia bacterium]|nr:hypothetical protein [Elusimicrobiota bacterium]
MSNRSISLGKSVIAVAISLSLVVLSPGFAAYEAAAQQVAGTRVVTQAATPGSGQVGTIRVLTGNSMPVSPLNGNAVSFGSVLPGVFAPSIKETAVLTGSIGSVLPMAVPTAVETVVLPNALHLTAPVKAQDSAPVQGPKEVEQSLTGMSDEVGQEVEAVGDISKAQSEGAHGLGVKLDSIITRTRQASSSDADLVPAAGRFGDLSGPSRLAAPDASAEISLAPEAGKSVPDAEPQRPLGKKQPLGARIIASVLALLPAALLGWPLFAAGAIYAGGAVLASSVLLAALPFMGDSTPKAIRAIPGFALLGLGGFTVFTALTGGTGLVMGALATLGGWGLVRYGLGKTVQDSRFDDYLALTAYFGGIGAVGGAALALMGPAGFIAAALSVLAYPTAALLLMHLPGWVGHGIMSIINSVRGSLRGMGRIAGAAWNDTPLVDRLSTFSERHLKVSKWNAVWLAGLWIPVWVLQLAGSAVGLVSGLAVTAMQAPVLFLWGASHKLGKDSRATKFFGAVSHFMFDNVQGAKKALFNRAERLLINGANSKSKAISIPSTLGIYLMSLAAAVAGVVATPFLFLAGVITGLGKTGQAYDPAKHDPYSLRVDRDDSPGEKPEEPTDPGQPAPPPGSTLVPRLIASAIALLPAVFLGWPLFLASPVVGVFYGAVTLSLAALPFVPANSAKALRVLPGVLMIMQGVLIPYLSFMMGPIGFGALLLATAKTNAFWMSVVNILGGWGLMRFLSRKAENGDEFSMDSGERIGAYFGALALMTGAGIVFSAATGVIPTVLTVGAYLLSPLLLMHLPKPIFVGLGSVFFRMWSSVRNSYKLFSAWLEDTKFHRNLESHAKHWLGKSVWNGAWLSVIWVPVWLSQLVEFALAGAVGLTLGVIRAPLNFLWGLSYDLAPKSRITRFFSAMARTSESMVEGESSRAFFSHYSGPFLNAMDERSESPSHRPTFKAGVSFVFFRIGQAFYLMKMALLLPVSLLMGAAFGVYNAFKGKADDSFDDPFTFKEPSKETPPETAPGS